MILVAVSIFVITVVAVLGFLFFRHQNKLKLRAYLMHEAVRNHEFAFRLPVKGLFFGERALQEVLNDLGQDINKLLVQNEVESWQRLTRVLTHEIMNVTTPIQSISQAYLEHPKVKGTSLEKGILAINEASTHLIVFIDSYRKLTQLQEPVIMHHNLRDIVLSITALYPEIAWETEVPDEDMMVDKSLLRQVFLNIIKNAIEAGARKMGMEMKDSKLLISNDGCPIPPEVRRDIFIPFYTTKQSGSGIGLSLSRQIMTIQGGGFSLADTAVAGYHTTFILEFRKNV